MEWGLARNSMFRPSVKNQRAPVLSSPQVLMTPHTTSFGSLSVLAAIGIVMLVPGAEALGGGPDSLTTTFNSNNGLDGNIFDVHAVKDIQIVGFDGNFNSGSGTVEVYTYPGSSSGHEGSSAGWTLVASGAINSAGTDIPTPLPFTVDIQIAAGETMGFYITAASAPGVRYTNGTGTGPAAQNADLIIDEGFGLAYPFGGSYSPRTWNGTIYYYSEVGEPYCFGDLSGNVCPCGNVGPPEAGCMHSGGTGGRLVGGGSTDAEVDTFTAVATDLPPNKTALLFAGTTQLGNGNGLIFGDGFRCAGGTIRRFGVRQSDSLGNVSWGPGLVSQGELGAGDTRNFQVWYRDIGTSSPCGWGFNLTNGLSVTFQ